MIDKWLYKNQTWLHKQAWMKQYDTAGTRVIRRARYNEALGAIWKTQLPNALVVVYDPREDAE